MSLLRIQILKIPAVRDLHKSRDTLLGQRDALSNELDACKGTLAVMGEPASAFLHYNAAFDAQAVIFRHAASGLQPHPKYLTNFLGVLIDPKFFPSILEGRAGEVEPIPIPANWHADITEWAAALRAVDLASDRFTMIELGLITLSEMAAETERIDLLQMDIQGGEADLVAACLPLLG